MSTNGIIGSTRTHSPINRLRNAHTSSTQYRASSNKLSAVRRQRSGVRCVANPDNASTTRPEMISLVELLSTCVDAAQRGCDEIRAVQERRSSSGGQLASTRKVLDDPRSALTEADTAAQIAIIKGLRATWPGLRIIGEEEDEPEAGDTNALRRDICNLDPASSSSRGIAEWKEPIDALTVFVDPVDGTREFVEGRLDAVQCLIGVSCRGRAVAGAIGLPFPEGTRGVAQPSVVWGIAPPGAASGVRGTFGGVRDSKRVSVRLSPMTTEGCVCVTGDSKNESLAAARAAVGAAAEVMIGGAGNKILAVADGRADVAIMHFGTSLWDTCAPEAVLRASGGKVTDLFGAPLVHSADRPCGGLLNDLGVLATAAGFKSVDITGRDHAQLAEAMRADSRLQDALLMIPSRMGNAAGTPSAGECQAMDIARCLDGAPLTTSFVGGQIASTLCRSDGKGEDAPFKLKGYSAPESAAVRGLMSDACRLELAWEGDMEATGMPSTCFYKRVAMGDLEYARTKATTQPLKIARDVKSASVEAAFLACVPVTTALTAAGVKIPLCFHADLRPCDGDPIESAFALLLEDFAPQQGWRQERLLTPSQACASLTAFARLHATFMPAAVTARATKDMNGREEDDALLNAVTASVWHSGTYWQPDFQPANQMTELAQIWRDVHMPSFSAAFTDALPELIEDVATVGERLQEEAIALAAEAHPFSEDPSVKQVDSGWAAKWKTVIHGDPKAGNMFFREKALSPLDGNCSWEVGLIDFQWMGFGVGASDVAHILCAACDPESLGYSADGKTFENPQAASTLLDHYHTELCAALVANGAAASVEKAAAQWTRAELEIQYQSCLLDMCRVIFGYQWVRVKASPETLKRNEKSMGRNSYNKSLPNAMWLVRECDRLLKARKARK